MFKYKKFLIRDTDRFDPYAFPQVQAELEEMMILTRSLPVTNKADILLSFLQDQPIKDEWVSANPRLAEFVNSNGNGTNTIKQLFDSSNNNNYFTEDLEKYVKEQVALS